jgi:hypothetical protein
VTLTGAHHSISWAPIGAGAEDGRAHADAARDTRRGYDTPAWGPLDAVESVVWRQRLIIAPAAPGAAAARESARDGSGILTAADVVKAFSLSGVGRFNPTA